MSNTDMRAAAKSFFTSTRYAVAGASSDPHKFGHKSELQLYLALHLLLADKYPHAVFAWYLQQSITPTPLNPRASSITVRSKPFDTVASPAGLASPQHTSLSVITPPAVTRQLLKEAKEAGIRAVWLQPGTFDDEILEQAKRDFEGAAVGGFEGLKGGERHEGWCLLVHGVEAMEGAEELGRGKL